VLVKAGFVAAGPADPAHLGGKPGTWFRRALTVGGERPYTRATGRVAITRGTPSQRVAGVGRDGRVGGAGVR
jgi:hypothetical protein